MFRERGTRRSKYKTHGDMTNISGRRSARGLGPHREGSAGDGESVKGR
jgi:hypothetical protein